MSSVPPRKRPRAKPKPLLAGSEPRRMELIGCDPDGNMSLWSVGDVLPVSAFERWSFDGTEAIRGGHYVIDWHGHAITVHCSTRSPGLVYVQFMRGGLNRPVMRLEDVEALLLGKVLEDPVHEAQIRRALIEIHEALSARRAAPHRQRGKIA